MGKKEKNLIMASSSNIHKEGDKVKCPGCYEESVIVMINNILCIDGHFAPYCGEVCEKPQSPIKELN